MCGIKWGLGAQVLISLLLSDETFFLNGAFFLHVITVTAVQAAATIFEEKMPC